MLTDGSQLNSCTLLADTNIFDLVREFNFNYMQISQRGALSVSPQLSVGV